MEFLQPKQIKWPNDAKIAVQFVLNYEEGARIVCYGDTQSEGFLSEIINAVPWPNQRHWNMESIYEYGARSGFGEFSIYLPNTIFPLPYME